MAKINTLIFDFGNVLVNLHSDEEILEILRELGKPAEGKISDMLLIPGGSETFWDVMRGKMSEEALWQMISEEWDIPYELAKEKMQLISAPNRPNRPLINYIISLAGKYKVGVLSNAGDATLEKLLQWYPFDRFVDHFVISAEVGMAKPDPEIYQHCLEVLGSKPEECVFIDDLPENIAAAEALGITGIVHRDNDETIEKLNTLLGED